VSAVRPAVTEPVDVTAASAVTWAIAVAGSSASDGSASDPQSKIIDPSGLAKAVEAAGSSSDQETGVRLAPSADAVGGCDQQQLGYHDFGHPSWRLKALRVDIKVGVYPDKLKPITFSDRQ
jgi:hypothetical protein